MLGFFRNDFGFGGNNGLTDFKDILGFNVQAAGTRNVLFAISCAVLVAALVMCRVIVTSKFGKVLVAIRDAESRVRFLGYRPESYKLAVFTLSVCMAGLAGALYVPQVGIINPGEFAPANSIEEVIWVAVGGRGTLTGAILGSIVVNYGKTYFTSGPLAPYWLFMLGGLFVNVTLMLPAGIIGTVQQRRYADLLRFALLTGAILAYFTFGPFLFLAAFGVALPDWLFVLGSLFVTLVLPAGLIAITGEGLSARMTQVRLRIFGPDSGLQAAGKT
jgi:hypothetical protein